MDLREQPGAEFTPFAIAAAMAVLMTTMAALVLSMVIGAGTVRIEAPAATPRVNVPAQAQDGLPPAALSFWNAL